MENPIARRVWVTGASSGLGLALVEQLLEQGAWVAASGRASQALQALSQQHPARLRLLDHNLINSVEAAKAARHIADQWGALDGLIINAGTCDYLALDTPTAAIFEGIVSSNLSAASHCLSSARVLLQGGVSPQVVAVLSRYSSLQLHKPGQPALPNSSLTLLFNSQRESLATQAIDLTVIAPLSLEMQQAPVHVTPEPWTAQRTANAILKRLPGHSAHLVLEALHQNNLWPLPR